MMSRTTSRRAAVCGLAGAGLAGCAAGAPGAPAAVALASGKPGFARADLAPLRLGPERLTRITVCTRPFRHAGPRSDVETVGDKRVVHNYGHGGSGWSLSWGSAEVAARRALETGPASVAVIGCGAIGLTTALTLRRAGVTTTIYAAERTADTRSARATGVWSPDSRVAAADRVDAGFPALWEAMARVSYRTYQTYLGLPGEPVAWYDRYSVFDGDADYAPQPGDVPFFAKRLDLNPRSRPLQAHEHPFRAEHVRHGTWLQFNVAALADRLTQEFLLEGGRIVRRMFKAPSELAGLAEPVIVNCTGYGARALFDDRSLVPVRGQIGWLAPQPEARYGVYYRGVSIVPRPDGVVVQRYAGDMDGFGVEDETPDPAETETCLAAVRPLFHTA